MRFHSLNFRGTPQAPQVTKSRPLSASKLQMTTVDPKFEVLQLQVFFLAQEKKTHMIPLIPNVLSALVVLDIVLTTPNAE